MMTIFERRRYGLRWRNSVWEQITSFRFVVALPLWDNNFWPSSILFSRHRMDSVFFFVSAVPSTPVAFRYTQMSLYHLVCGFVPSTGIYNLVSRKRCRVLGWGMGCPIWVEELELFECHCRLMGFLISSVLCPFTVRKTNRGSRITRFFMRRRALREFIIKRTGTDM